MSEGSGALNTAGSSAASIGSEIGSGMSSGGSAAGGAAESIGGAAGGASAMPGAGSAAGGAAPSVGQTGATAGGDASPSHWYTPITNAITDYGKGSQGNLGDALKNVKEGNYMRAGGYVGGKLQSMNPGNAPTPLIQLPQGQGQNQDPMNRYAQLYAKYRGQ